MKRVRKSPDEPQELADYRARFALAPVPPTWKEFNKDPRRRESVKNRLREDQRGLCAYCESETDNLNLFLQANTAHPNGQSYEMEGFEGGFHIRFYEGHGFHLGLAWENEWQRGAEVR